MREKWLLEGSGVWYVDVTGGVSSPLMWTVEVMMLSPLQMSNWILSRLILTQSTYLAPYKGCPAFCLLQHGHKK